MDNTRHTEQESTTSANILEKLSILVKEKIEDQQYYPYLEYAIKGLIGDTFDDSSEKAVADLATKAIKAVDLFLRTKSVLALGVLTPEDLVAKNIKHTTSSDMTLQALNIISLFDINIGRNDRKDVVEERFSFPGHQSIAPVLERQGDTQSHWGKIVNDGIKKIPGALQIFSDFRTKMNEIEPGTFTDDENISPVVPNFRTLVEKIERNRLLFVPFFHFLFSRPGYKRLLQGRASRSVMFICTKGSNLEAARAKAGLDIQELRVSKSLEPQFITTVLLPKYMQGFTPLLKEFRPGITFLFVPDTSGEVEVGYYDHSGGVSTRVEIVVPNYQAAIDQLIEEGITNMLTHIAKIE